MLLIEYNVLMQHIVLNFFLHHPILTFHCSKKKGGKKQEKKPVVEEEEEEEEEIQEEQLEISSGESSDEVHWV